MFLATLLTMALAFSPIADVATNYTDYETDNLVETVAGTGHHGVRGGEYAQFNLPTTIFSNSAGDLLVVDTHNNLIRTLNEEGHVTLLAGTLLDVDAFGFPRGAHRDGRNTLAIFNRPSGGVIDNQGRIFIADSMNHAIRLIVRRNVYTFAGSREPGHADGTPENARFNRPTALATGPCGGIFVADSLNHVIRRVDPANGHVTTIAGTPGVYGHNDGASNEAVFNTPMGIAVSQDGAIFVADTENHLIRVIENGYVRTLAGNLIFPDDIEWENDVDFDDMPMGSFADGEESGFNLPTGLALWNDMLIVADTANHRIRGVLPCGYTITIAGNGYAGHTDGLASYSEFHFPRGVYVTDDRLFVADTNNNIIRSMVLSLEGGN